MPYPRLSTEDSDRRALFGAIIILAIVIVVQQLGSDLLYPFVAVGARVGGYIREQAGATRPTPAKEAS